MLMRVVEALHVSGHWLLTEEGPLTPPGTAESEVYERGRAAGWREAVEGLRGLESIASPTAGGGAEMPPEILALARRLMEAESNPVAAQPPAPPRGDAVTG